MSIHAGGGSDGDPYGLTGFGVGDLAGRPGEKWSLADGRLASWVADMDFPIAPAIVERLTGSPSTSATRRGTTSAAHRCRSASPSGCPSASAGRPTRRGCTSCPTRCKGSPSPSTTSPRRATASSSICRHIRRSSIWSATPAGGSSTFRPGNRRGFAWDYDELDARLAGDPQRSRPCPAVDPVPSAEPDRPRVRPRRSWSAIAELAAAHDLVVVSDEIHAELVHPGHTHVPFATLGDDVAARTITVTSASKAFNLAGLRWAVLCAGPHRVPRGDLPPAQALSRRAEPAGGRGDRRGMVRGRRLAGCGARRARRQPPPPDRPARRPPPGGSSITSRRRRTSPGWTAPRSVSAATPRRIPPARRRARRRSSLRVDRSRISSASTSPPARRCWRRSSGGWQEC